MVKIKRIIFKNHPILKDLIIDCCDKNGQPVDTIILAGENGCGKTTILSELSFHSGRKVHRSSHFEYTFIEYDNDDEVIEQCIYSDTSVNLGSASVGMISGSALDIKRPFLYTDPNFAKTIHQLLVDVSAMDDTLIAKAAKENPNKSLSEMNIDLNMDRFTNAFQMIFDDLRFKEVRRHTTSEDEYFEIIFQKNGTDITIENLSSGEKQIVYRGAFMLKDKNAMQGALVLLDEPETSLHPRWQKKILDYYKQIFTNQNGVQTSQIFVATHSPFIVHNENRQNEKVIVLKRDENGDIVVCDKPEYYRCGSMQPVEDAFEIHDFNSEKPTVFLEGRTDEMYFRKALEVFGYDVPFEFRWVGYMDEQNQEVNTGKDALNKAFQFLIGRNLPTPNVCLFDCDTNRQDTEKNNVYARTITHYDSDKIKIGIENALILDGIDLSAFYSQKTKTGNYGEKTIREEFEKMKLCKHICDDLTPDQQRIVLANLKTIIDSVITIFK